MSGALAPARIRARRCTVATERYVEAETVDNLPLATNTEDNNMDIEESLPVNNQNENRIISSNSDRNAAGNLAIFNEIPSLVQNPSGFHDYHRQIVTARQSARITCPLPATLFVTSIFFRCFAAGAAYNQSFVACRTK